MPFKIIRDFKSCSEYTLQILSADEPAFLSRIGGSDTIAVAADVASNAVAENRMSHVDNYKSFVEKYNGFYDTQEGDRGFLNYLDIMTDCYCKSKSLFVGGTDLRIMLYPELEDAKVLHDEARKRYEALFNRMDDGSEKVFLPYEYIETMTYGEHNIANVFSQVLNDKKVLVVSPFSNTIKSNFNNRNYFFKQYRYPDFELLTCDAPITYAGLPKHLYPDQNWSGTANRLIEEMSNIDFDIVLLCCGSYAMPLGVAAAEELGKKAVYLGGVTQLFFGIIGRRYEIPFFLQQMNAEFFVRPAESSKFLGHIEVAPGSETEAFGAYF
ncbi:hypothetical protein [Methylorubrum zatmanii]